VKVRYCTLFDRKYLTRGLAMLASLGRHLKGHEEIIVLAMDEPTQAIMANREGRGLRVVTVDDLDDAELTALRKTRPRREFCWTCTPALCAWAVRTGREGDLVVYLDADLSFFADPGILLEELAGAYNVLIHEHRFSPDRIAHEASSGRFNVGLVGFRVGPEGRDCVERWRAQTIEKCEIGPGHYGDQKYLEEWPSRYPGVRILHNIGGGVAPWNVNQYRLGRHGGVPTVDGKPIIFYHYHALETLIEPRWGLIAVRPSIGYRFSRRAMNILYGSYARELRRIDRELRKQGFADEGDRVSHWFDLAIRIFLGRYIRAI
jgi:hypothetical protein